MSTPTVETVSLTTAATAQDTRAALRFVTCGSVDDGKSTLIGRLLVDSRAVLQDHLAGVQRGGETDLALLTDGLSAEREQGITIDVAYRYFSTESRKFIIADAPGHEQYTRNMVTAASSADAAVVLVDATKLTWEAPSPELLPQTRRHSLLVDLLRVPSIVFAINKLDAVANPALAFAHISAALSQFAKEAQIPVKAIVPVSALIGYNVVDAHPGWCDYQGPSLLEILEHLPATPADTSEAFAFPVQWVEKFHPARTPRRDDVSSGVALPAVQYNRASRLPCCRVGKAPQWPKYWTIRANPRLYWPGTAPASSWTANWTCHAVTGCWRRADSSHRWACAKSPRKLPGWTTNPWYRAACTGPCRATAGSRPKSSVSSTR